MREFRCFVFLTALLAASSAGASDFDGSRALTCTTQYVLDTGGPNETVSGLPSQLGAPTFMQIDFERKSIAGAKRATPIRLMEKTGKQLLLHGTELNMGWTLSINEQDGTMTGSLVDDGGVTAMFGVCKPA